MVAAAERAGVLRPGSILVESSSGNLGVALSMLVMCTELANSAAALTSATITPSLSPDRLNAKGALTLTIHYAGGEFGVPAAVRRLLVRFPAGLSLDADDS